jgi:PilZ domain
MPQKLLDVLSLGHCSHEFSWPRRAPNGYYYQVCLLCASEYKYDWTTMRRTERLQNRSAETVVSPRASERERKPTWVPRARRLKLAEPVRYRVKNMVNWYPGTIRNLSQSGVLLLCKQNLPVNTLVEMIFAMPEEISGQKNASVLCQGRIVRSFGKKKSKHDAEETGELAATILDYKFLRHN